MAFRSSTSFFMAASLDLRTDSSSISFFKAASLALRTASSSVSPLTVGASFDFTAARSEISFLRDAFSSRSLSRVRSFS